MAATKATIGVIGQGRFGSLLSKVLKAHWHGAAVLTFDHSKNNLHSPKQVAAADLVIQAVPMSALHKLLRDISTLLRTDATVLDVCSVKVFPAKWMRETVGTGAGLIATHPVFGPDSTKDGTEFRGLKMMMYNISGAEAVYNRYKAFWERLGVEIIEMTPEDHDRFSAYSIAYNHLVGRMGELIGIKPTPIGTKGFEVIYKAMTYVTDDTWQLFEDMQNFNPFAKRCASRLERPWTLLQKN